MEDESPNDLYLKNNITYTDDGRLLDYNGDSVMMDWEDNIMRDAAALICRDGGKILNIGFGLGLIDNYIQSYNPEEHWIIEAHPQVANKIKEEGWDKKKNVTCIFDKWQNVLKDLPKFDGIYFDTWQEKIFIGLVDLDKPLVDFLNPGGKLLEFNGRQTGTSVVRRMGFKVEEHITILNKVDPNQKSNGETYWNPKRTKFYHQLIIKPINNK